MLALKGNCVKCKNRLSVFSPGFVCNDCEISVHGTCLVPPMDIPEMESYIVKTQMWLCGKCKTIRGKQFEEDTRPNFESKEIKKKLEMINEVRQLLLQIEKALVDTTKDCEVLTEKAKHLQKKNLDLRIRLITHKNRGNILPQSFKIKPQIEPTVAKDTTTKKSKRKRYIWQRKKKHDSKPHMKKEDMRNPDEVGFFIKDLRHYAYTHGLGIGERILMWLQGSLTHLSKGWLLNVVLLFIIFIYTLFGALLFTLIEGRYEHQLVQAIFERRLAFMQNVTKGTSNQEITEKLEKYYDFMAESYSKNGKLLQRGDVQLNWSFLGSVFFCGTTYTTMGYGDIVPVTNLGKVATILYAILGIPLCLCLIASLGQTLTRLIKFHWNCCRQWSKCCRVRKGRRPSIEPVLDENEVEFSVPVWMALVLEIIYLIIGAYIFTYGTNWSLFESFYFSFVSILTIGFGEYVPDDISYMMGAFLYIVCGLSLTTMNITLIRAKLTASFEKATRKLGTTIEQYIEEQYLDDLDDY